MLSYESFLDAIEGSNPLPQIMAQAAAKLKDPEATVDDIAELLRSDATIVASIVQCSNSSYFGFATEATSLDEAIQRIGLREILVMISACIAQDIYRKELSHYCIPPEVYWESSIAAALLMESISKAAGRESDDAYMAGLMREIGMVVIDFALNQQQSSARWDRYTPVLHWERDLCGYDHTETGYAILTRWSFPEEVRVAVAQQWEPPAGKPFLAVALHLTNLLLERSGCDYGVHIENFKPYSEIAQLIGIDSEQLAEAYENARERFLRLKADLIGA